MAIHQLLPPDAGTRIDKVAGLEARGFILGGAVAHLLTTGSTDEAGIKLVERLGGVIVGGAFVVNLPDLGGRRKLETMGMEVHALGAFEGL